METFIPAQPDPPNINKVERLIKKFNKIITARLSGVSGTTGSISLNTTLDSVPELTADEFFIAHGEAVKNGYTLEQFNDEHDTITYILRKS
jgi:hypothetical protein